MPEARKRDAGMMRTGCPSVAHRHIRAGPEPRLPDAGFQARRPWQLAMRDKQSDYNPCHIAPLPAKDAGRMGRNTPIILEIGGLVLLAGGAGLGLYFLDRCSGRGAPSPAPGPNGSQRVRRSSGAAQYETQAPDRIVTLQLGGDGVSAMPGSAAYSVLGEIRRPPPGYQEREESPPPYSEPTTRHATFADSPGEILTTGDVAGDTTALAGEQGAIAQFPLSAPQPFSATMRRQREIGPPSLSPPSDVRRPGSRSASMTSSDSAAPSLPAAAPGARQASRVGSGDAAASDAGWDALRFAEGFFV